MTTYPSSVPSPGGGAPPPDPGGAPRPDRRPAIAATLIGLAGFGLVFLLQPEVARGASPRAALLTIGLAIAYGVFVAVAFRLVQGRWVLAGLVGVPLFVAAGAFAAVNLVDQSADDEVAEELATQLAESEGAAPPPSTEEPTAGAGGDPTATSTAAPAAPVRLASDAFIGLEDHRASGQASLVQLPDGSRVVLFEDFDVEPGPDFRVLLVPGPGNHDHTSGTELGALQGNVGDQQYAVPEDFDTDSPFTVLIWCGAFDVNVAAASPGF